VGVYKPCRCNFKCKTHKGWKHQNKHMIFLKVSLAKLKVGGGDLLMSRMDNFFFAERFEHLQYHLDSKARETHNTT
jgi:hypothetical protein